jgi:hypothetical protein
MSVPCVRMKSYGLDNWALWSLIMATHFLRWRAKVFLLTNHVHVVTVFHVFHRHHVHVLLMTVLGAGCRDGLRLLLLSPLRCWCEVWPASGSCSGTGARISSRGCCLSASGSLSELRARIRSNSCLPVSGSFRWTTARIRNSSWLLPTSIRTVQGDSRQDQEQHFSCRLPSSGSGYNCQDQE